MEDQKASNEFLHFGQLISICLEEDSYIYSKGFIDNSLYLQQLNDTESYDFSAAIFRVLPQCMYSVQNDLLTTSHELSSTQFIDKFSRHEESLEGEIKTNIQTYNNFKGEPVRFGSIIQLQHVMSYKFITIIPQENAEFEKENLRLRLTEFASECSYIRIEPGYKFQKESDGLVRIGDRVVFEIMLPELIRAAYFNTSDYLANLKTENLEEERMKREVNASLDHKVKWKVKQYSKYILERENNLLCGDYIWITHSEEEACLVANCKTDGNNVFFSSNVNDTNGMWKIEAEKDTEGGYVSSDKPFRIKHAISGMYLSLTQEGEKIQGVNTFSRALMSKISKKSVYTLVLSEKKDVLNLWKFQPLHNNKKPRRIGRDDFCVLINSESGNVLHGVEDKKLDQNSSIVPQLKTETTEDAYFKVFKCEDSLIWGTLFLLDCLPILNEFPNFVRKHSQEMPRSENYSMIREFKKHAELIQKCLDNLVLFCKNKLKSMITLDKQFGHVEALRQKILREQLFIDALAEILNTMFVGIFGLSKLAILGKQEEAEAIKKKQKDASGEIYKSQLATIANIAKSIYVLLQVICRKNKENQDYSFKFFKVFQKHAAYGLGATKTLMVILDDNESLLLKLHKSSGISTDRSSDSLITHYSWLLRKFYRERKPQLVEFLKFICTYKGEGISVNQEKIHDMLFGNPETHSKAVITTSTISDKMTLYVFLQHPSGIGEENVSLESCFSNGEIDPRYLIEIEYFTRMLELFSDMCTGRNYICKASIKDWFPIQVLVSSIWNDQLSPDIRAAFMKLMLNMHVDSQPRQESKKPELIRVLGLCLKEDQKLVHRQRHSIVNLDSGLDISRRMNKRFTHIKKAGIAMNEETEAHIVRFVEDEVILYELKENIISFLKEEGIDPKFSILTHFTLKMGRKLAKFELIGVACSGAKEGFCILNPKHEMFSYEKMDIIRLIKVMQPLLLYGNDKMLSRSDKQITSSNLTNTKKKTQESFESLLNKLLREANSLGDPIVRYSDNVRNFLRSSMLANEFSDDSRSCETKCKTEICQFLHYVLDWRQDYLISNIIMWFNLKYLENDSNSKEIISLFPPIMETQKVEVKVNYLKLKFDTTKEVISEFKTFVDPEIKDLSCMGSTIITQLFKIFCITDDYKLQSLIINLILRSFNQRTELLKNIKKLHVMTLLQDTEIFTWTKSSLHTFKQLSEQSELWLKYWIQTPYLMEKNIEKLEAVQLILEKFYLIMLDDTSIEQGLPVVGTSQKIDKDRQMMCTYLSLDQYIVHLLKDGMYTLADIYDDPKNHKENEGRTRLLKLFQGCYSVLTTMCKGNPKIQKKLYSYMSVFTTFLRIPVGQIELICEIFRDNPHICSLIKEDFVQQFLELIITEGRQARFLMVFEIIQSPCNQPLPEIQRMVILQLLNPINLNHVCYMTSDGSKFSFDTLETPPLFSPHYKDEPIIYHSILIKVLKLCGQGSSGVYLTEAKCQKIISINQIFELLNKDDLRFSILHIPLLGFFFHIYLDSEQKVEELESSKDFINYINKVTLYISNYNSESEVNIDFFEVWINIMDAYSQHYLQDIHSFRYHDDVESLCGFLEAVSNKWELVKKVKLSEETFRKLQELGEKYNFTFMNAVEVEEIYYTAPKFNEGASVKSRWQDFCGELLYSDSFKPLLSEEHQALYTLVYDIEKIEPSLSASKIFKLIINFIKESPIFKPPLDVLVNVIMFLSAILTRFKSEKESQRLEMTLKLQNEFCEYGAVRITLGLICSMDTPEEAYTALIHFAIKLLEGGNETAQQNFYQYFITMTSSSVFFERMKNSINNYIEKAHLIEEKGLLPIFKAPDLRITKILKLLQLLCENHNQLLQNYLRIQTNSRNNYDMVALTISLLEELTRKKQFQDFLIISQCFDTLTEYIQGPCRENQKAIIDSKFLEVASGLLSLDEKSDYLNKYENLLGENMKVQAQTENCLKGWMVAHLKYKCMITIQSLLEGQIDNYVITRMIRALNIEIFKENLISIYMSYLNSYAKGYYDYPLFQHYEGNDEYIFGQVNDQDKNPEKYQFIIETGFLIYHLMSCFKDNDDPENKAIIENELPELMIKEEASNFIATKLIGDLGKIGLNLFKSGFSVVTRIARLGKAKVAMNEEDRKKILDEAYKYFQVNSGNVEVIFTDKKLFKVYFWIPPECHHFTKESKEDLHDKIDRSSDKAKVQDLIQRSGDMIEEMQHEFRLSKFYNKYKAVSFFTSHVTVWKELSFTMTLVLNFFIIFSYYQDDGDSRMNPSLFYGETGGLTTSNTKNALRVIGIIQCVCSILIVTFFIMKTAPVLIKRGWRKHTSSQGSPGFILGLFLKIKNGLLTLYFTLSNVDVLYHILYMVCSILGITANPLFFSLHLLDILYRYPSLQNVIKSIVLPYKSLLLTFILILILIYLFSIWAFLGLSQYYSGNCENMIMCIKTTFDQGIKNGGGIGQYLDQIVQNDESVLSNYEIIIRFIFDDLFNIIIMIIMMNIIQGIIIDTFAVLREKSDRNSADRLTKCFICGKEKEYIERCTNRPFRYHCVYEHNEWNYVYFIAYLKNKESTEHTGIESSIFQLLEDKDISWVPQQQGLTLTDIENNDEIQLTQKFDNISNTYENLQKEMRDIKKYFSDYLETKQEVEK